VVLARSLSIFAGQRAPAALPSAMATQTFPAAQIIGEVIYGPAFALIDKPDLSIEDLKCDHSPVRIFRPAESFSGKVGIRGA